MIVAVRHAPPLAAGLCYGRSDIPVGVPAEVAAGTIAARLARRPDRVWSSPSPRCAAPAAELAARFSAPHHVDARLYELDFGAWEGRAWADLERDDGERLRAWSDGWQRAAPPGGETVAALQARVARWLAELDRAEAHLLVGHAGVIRALDVLLGGDDWPSAIARPVAHLEPRVFADLTPRRGLRPR